ncbi:MAG: 50S ribosome-binding GTPase, partial [Gammaproteobacteria bacterium]|nr:50S ribosome-binding GTPase [Gammaproteobacteria bacterium]
LLREGMRVVLAGQPNTGKSSLLNCLAGRESAIVTDIPGTTRDVLKEEINIDGMPLHIIDTAGLRDIEDSLVDPVEKEGMRRTWKEIEQANIVLLLFDDSQGFGVKEKQILKQLPKHIPVTLVHNKIDLSQHKAELQIKNENVHLWLSIKENNGLDMLRDHLKSSVGYTGMGEGQFMARRRHLVALNKARDHIEAGLIQLKEQAAGELLAEELRVAQQALGEITGEVSSDELLGKIFSSFCIGK